MGEQEVPKNTGAADTRTETKGPAKMIPRQRPGRDPALLTQEGRRCWRGHRGVVPAALPGNPPSSAREAYRGKVSGWWPSWRKLPRRAGQEHTEAGQAMGPLPPAQQRDLRTEERAPKGGQREGRMHMGQCPPARQWGGGQHRGRASERKHLHGASQTQHNHLRAWRQGKPFSDITKRVRQCTLRKDGA